MKYSRRNAFRCLGNRPLALYLGLAAIGCMSAGCVSPWYNDFLNPSQVGNFRENRVTEILRSVSFRDKPAGIVGTVDPTPEDLVAYIEPYRIGPGDVLDIRILDLYIEDAESVLQVRVDELGYIVVSQIGRIHVEGLTAEELEMQLKNKAIAKGIFSEESEPTMIVSYIEQRQRLFMLAGAIARPGQYPMPKPDLRLREAIVFGGSLDDLVKWVYVFRDDPRPKVVVEDAAQRKEPMRPVPDTEQQAPPVSPLHMSDVGRESDAVTLPAETQTTDKTNGGRETRSAQRELIDAVAPPPGDVTAETQTSPADDEAGSADTEDEAMLPSRPPFIFVNDHFVETTEDDPAPGRVVETRAAPTAPSPPPTQSAEKVNWDELVSETTQRIIKIPAENLRNGDANYNIVIRPGDEIRLTMGPTGNYYVMGRVRSPGFNRIQRYDFAGEDITLRQAIASVGGLDDLAWPTRCELIRRLEGDREEITQWNLARIMDGQDPDLYLKAGDVVNVGTHAIARFLFNIRNAFNINYGFGFTYSRNFADIDSFGGKVNPETLERAARQTRFPGLF